MSSIICSIATVVVVASFPELCLSVVQSGNNPFAITGNLKKKDPRNARAFSGNSIAGWTP